MTKKLILLFELYMCHSPLVPIGVTRKTREKLSIILFKHARMNPYSCSRVSRLFRAIVVGNIWNRCDEILRELISRCLDLLHEKDIRILFGKNPCKFSLLMSCSDSVDVPGDNSHVIQLLQISRDCEACRHHVRACSRHGRRRAA